jgi:TatD DNase family protein
MRLVDTHCHLQDRAFDADRDEVLRRALDALEFLVVVGDDLENSRKAAALCGDRVYAVVGFHPYHAVAALDSLDALRELLARPGVVALGEIGLDYYNKFAPEDAQREAFRRQLELAAETKLPVVIHSREAQEDTSAILREHAAALPGGIMHCFAGDASFAEECASWGFNISFAGNVTFPKAAPLRDAASAVPLERLLVETDSPYLAPQPVRGKRCEPAYVRHTAETLAALKAVDLDTFAEHTTRSARRIFRIDPVD